MDDRTRGSMKPREGKYCELRNGKLKVRRLQARREAVKAAIRRYAVQRAGRSQR